MVIYSYKLQCRETPLYGVQQPHRRGISPETTKSSFDICETKNKKRRRNETGKIEKITEAKKNYAKTTCRGNRNISKRVKYVREGSSLSESKDARKTCGNAELQSTRFTLGGNDMENIQAPWVGLCEEDYYDLFKSKPEEEREYNPEEDEDW